MRTAQRVGLVLVAVLVLIQFIPVSKTNPPATRALAERSCFDCHSNETRFPWWVPDTRLSDAEKKP